MLYAISIFYREIVVNEEQRCCEADVIGEPLRERSCLAWHFSEPRYVPFC